MKLCVYSSFEPAFLGRVLDLWNSRVPLFSSIVVQGPQLLSWGLRAEVPADELRAFVLDPAGVRLALAEGIPGALQSGAGGPAPLVFLCPDGAGAPAPELLAASRAEVIDGAAVARAARLPLIMDPDSERIAGVPYRDGFYLAIGTELHRRSWRRLRPEPKVLAIDCDGTLWQGLSAEAGPAGVTFGPEERALQEFLRQQKRAGRLLVLVSKNVPADVDAVFAARSELGLSPADFAARRIGWEPKPQALRELSRELGLALDSFVFLDDSAAECAEVRAALPEVAVLLRPAEDVLGLLEAVWPLDLRAEQGGLGEQRTQLYREEVQRLAALRAAPSFAEHVRSLQVHCEVRAAQPVDEARVRELSWRTNQFNTAAERPEAEAVYQAVARGQVLAIRVSDRFGDYGLSGAVFLTPAGDALRVDRLLLSCRVLGRGVEEAVFDALAAQARALGFAWLEFSFSATARNLPALRFLEGAAERLGGQRLSPKPGVLLLRFTAPGLPPCPPPQSLAGDQEPVEERPPAARAPDWMEIARLGRDLAALGGVIGLQPERLAAPAEPGEAGVLAVVAEVLGRPVGRGENLYALGADSLRLVRILALLRSRLGLELPIGEVLHRADVADLLALCARQAKSAPAAEDRAFLAQVRSLYDVEEPGA